MDRMHNMDERKAFLVPVVIDGTAERGPTYPRSCTNRVSTPILSAAYRRTCRAVSRSIPTITLTPRVAPSLMAFEQPHTNQSASRATNIHRTATIERSTVRLSRGYNFLTGATMNARVRFLASCVLVMVPPAAFGQTYQQIYIVESLSTFATDINSRGTTHHSKGWRRPAIEFQRLHCAASERHPGHSY